MRKRAELFEKSLIDLSIKSNGKISLIEAYNMPFMVREKIIKVHNEMVQESSKTTENYDIVG